MAGAGTGRVSGPRVHRAGTVRVPDAPLPRLGVDVVDVHRLERLLALRGAAVRARVFTPDELAACGDDVPRLAARLAAKEAVAKALGTGVGPVAWRDVEVRNGASGVPRLTLRGGARAAARARRLSRWTVSLTHDRDHATAVAMAVPDRGGRRGPR